MVAGERCQNVINHYSFSCSRILRTINSKDVINIYLTPTQHLYNIDIYVCYNLYNTHIYHIL